jgi:very-short-patch-repair endonuclease
MDPIERSIRRGGLFLRRRELRAQGFSDRQIRAALQRRSIFRVRHGWYSVPDAPESAIRAVRVGGRLTSTSALETYGLRVPRRPALHVAVVATASRLRRPDDRRARLRGVDPVRVHWVDRRASGGNSWRVSIDDALLAVLIEEPRDIAVACCSAVAHVKRWSARRLDALFRRAPDRVQCWRGLVSALDESHGETFARLWLTDAGVRLEQQVRIRGVGRLDFRVGPNTFVEIDGAQHDPLWTGVSKSSWDSDHDRDTTVAIGGGTVLRYNYRQLYSDWARVLAAIQRVVADDLALTAYRRRHPYRPRARRKRRTSVSQTAW